MTTPHQPQPHTDGWQPIATAPKDGTQILIYCSFEGVIAVEWMRDVWTHVSGRYDIACDSAGSRLTTMTTASHWRPLPAPPIDDVGETDTTLPKPPSTTQSHNGETE